MSKRVIESNDDSTGKSRQTTQSYQPLWMAHWTQASSHSTAERRDDSARRDKELVLVSKYEDLTSGSEATRSVKEHSVSETRAETESLRMSSKSLGNEAVCTSVMKHGENTDETKAIRPISNYRIQSPAGVPAAKETSFREYHSISEGTSKNPLKWVKTCVSTKDTSPATSTPFLGSSKQVVPYQRLEKNEFDKGKAVVFPSLSRPSIWLQKVHNCSDVNISKENDVFRSPSDFFGQANRGVKLQPLSSSSNSEGQWNARDIGVGTSKAAIKNESSAETDTMVMDYLKEERTTSVANSTRSTKGFKFGTNLSSPRYDVTSSKEAVRPRKDTGLPDMNLELPPASPAAASSPENAAGPSSSRTQSLEMDVLLAHADHPTPKSNDSDPTTRWVKRLKATSSDSSGRGTKSSKLPENLSYDKRRAFFKNVVNSEPAPRKIIGKEIMLPGRSQEEEEQGKELLLSHAWIKRWLRSGSQKKPEAIVVCEPQSSKTSLDDIQKKQFPSIAAMALMGKAMSGYQSCELQKRGNFTVWNTKAF